MLQDEGFKNNITNAIINKLIADNELPVGMIKPLYAAIGENLPIRRLLVNMVVLDASKDLIREQKELFNDEFLVDTTSALMEFRPLQMKPKAAPYMTNPCLYHKHTYLRNPCYKKE